MGAEFLLVVGDVDTSYGMQIVDDLEMQVITVTISPSDFIECGLNGKALVWRQVGIAN